MGVSSAARATIGVASGEVATRLSPALVGDGRGGVLIWVSLGWGAATPTEEESLVTDTAGDAAPKLTWRTLWILAYSSFTFSAISCRRHSPHHTNATTRVSQGLYATTTTPATTNATPYLGRAELRPGHTNDGDHQRDVADEIIVCITQLAQVLDRDASFTAARAHLDAAQRLFRSDIQVDDDIGLLHEVRPEQRASSFMKHAQRQENHPSKNAHVVEQGDVRVIVTCVHFARVFQHLWSHRDE